MVFLAVQTPRDVLARRPWYSKGVAILFSTKRHKTRSLSTPGSNYGRVAAVWTCTSAA